MHNGDSIEKSTDRISDTYKIIYQLQINIRGD
jgi:hypothetical protein